MAKNSASTPSNMKVSKISSGDRVANNAQPKDKNLGVTTDAMKKWGRNLARAKNQGN